MKNLSKFALFCVISMFGFNVVAAEPAPATAVKQEVKKDELNKDEKKDEKKEEIKK